VDLSSPERASINDGINARQTSLLYVGVRDTAEEILSIGVGAQLSKRKLKGIQEYPGLPGGQVDDWHEVGGWFFIDTALPFGLHFTPKIFMAVSDAVEWILKREGVRFAIYYLDDFLVMGGPDSPECARALEKLLELLEWLGFLIAVEQLEGPMIYLAFLGLEVDSGAMTIQLPERKLKVLSSSVNWIL